MRILLGMFTLVLTQAFACGSDDPPPNLIKWKCYGYCSNNLVCAETASMALQSASCTGYDASCETTGDSCSCPSGAEVCAITD
jgi:hypothetical protein